MGKVDRKAMREALLKRTQESHERREDSGRFGSIFKEQEGLRLWKCTEMEHLIDIIPFIAGPNHPDTEAGEVAYVLDIWVHRGIGVNEDSFICPARTYKTDCPICEYQKELREADADEDLVKALWPKRRTLYNVVCYNSEKEEAKGVQVWEVAHWFMERHLTPLAKKPKGGGFVLFSDPDIGKSIAFERKGTKQENTEFLGHKFEDREGPIPDEILDAVYTLDQIVEIPTPEKLYNAFWGSKGRPTEEEAAEEPTKEEAGEDEAAEEPAKEAAEETPAALRKKIKPKPKTKVELLRKQRAERKKQEAEAVQENECPVGGQFGLDLDTLEACDECEAWEKCAKRTDELEQMDQPSEAPQDDIPF